MLFRSMPKDTIERAIKKASGVDSANYTEVSFEGYGPCGVAIFVECATDNNTRTVSNVRSYFNKYGGSLGKDGCLEFVFSRKGIYTLSSVGIDEEEFSLEMIDAGAEDVEFEDEMVTVSCDMEEFGNIQKKLTELRLEPLEAGLQRIPNDTKDIDVNDFQKVMRLVDIIEDDDDVQKVYHNIEFTDELAQAME